MWLDEGCGTVIRTIGLRLDQRRAACLCCDAPWRDRVPLTGSKMHMTIVFIGDIHQMWDRVERGVAGLLVLPKAAVILGDVQCDRPLDMLAEPLLSRGIVRSLEPGADWLGTGNGRSVDRARASSRELPGRGGGWAASAGRCGGVGRRGDGRGCMAR